MNEPLAPRGPAEIQHFLQTKREELDRLDHDLQLAHDVAEEAAFAWEDHLDEILNQLEEERDGKLPGEDVRNSIARRRGGGEVWNNHRRAERQIKRLEQRERLISKQIGAAQSEAKLMGVV